MKSREVEGVQSALLIVFMYSTGGGSAQVIYGLYIDAVVPGCSDSMLAGAEGEDELCDIHLLAVHTTGHTWWEEFTFIYCVV